MSYDTARYGGAVVSRDRGEGVELRVLGTRVAVDTSSLTSDERTHLHSLWGWCLIDPNAAPPEPGIRLVHERGTESGPPTQIVVGTDWEALPYRLSGAVTIEALRQHVGTDLLFHAAGLSDGAGRVVVLVAASGTGKTTAARTLATRLGYVSDESVAIRPDGSVTAYPKPLSFVQGESRVRKVEVSPEAAGLIRAPGGLTFARQRARAAGSLLPRTGAGLHPRPAARLLPRQQQRYPHQHHEPRRREVLGPHEHAAPGRSVRDHHADDREAAGEVEPEEARAGLRHGIQPTTMTSTGACASDPGAARRRRHPGRRVPPNGSTSSRTARLPRMPSQTSRRAAGARRGTGRASSRPARGSPLAVVE